MHKKRILIRSFVLLCFLLGTFQIVNPMTGHAFSNQVIQQGAVGDDVIELQGRLKHLGFYTGNVDGAFGWGTYWALRNFQYEFGLPIDGLAGQATKSKLVKATPKYGGAGQGGAAKAQPPKAAAPKPTASNTPKGFSQNDIRLMANAVHGESRGEPYIGQVAVAAVILNRVNSSTFPNTVSGVIFEPGAFTAVADGQIWLTPNETSKKAVIDAINGWDPTGEALYYFNPATATSSWIWSRPQIKKIGQHIFCK
ncbi:spore cortex-lytic enzyme [Neobacillus niacini]|uniref:spore cortex-lytic enzyme n=1 Tax=Neobacillus niacini TaxID=86668 RepID=UPI0037C52865